MIGPQWWDSRPVVLIGGGPSLRGFDLGRLSHVNATIVGINQAMFDTRCDAGFSADSEFIAERRQTIESLIGQGVEIILTDHSIERATHVVRRLAGGLSTDLNAVNTGGDSGKAALDAAVLKRARKVVLLGFDYGADGSGRDHYHDAYRPRPHNGWLTWAGYYDAALPTLKTLGVTVIDASPHGALSCFSKMSIDEALANL